MSVAVSIALLIHDEWKLDYIVGREMPKDVPEENINVIGTTKVVDFTEDETHPKVEGYGDELAQTMADAREYILLAYGVEI